MRVTVLLLVVAAGLAGCADKGSHEASHDDEGGASGMGAHGQHDAATHILAPTWEVGQWWTFSSDQATAPFTHVVSADKGDDWLLDTDSPDIAFFDARFDIGLTPNLTVAAPRFVRMGLRFDLGKR